MIWPFSRPKQKTAFELSASGRPIRPNFSQFHPIDEATPEDRALALAWAKEWRPVGDIDAARAAHILDRLLLWDTKADDASHEAQIAEVAWRALFYAKEEYATARTARIRSYILFEETCCDASRPYQGRFMAATERPALPLVDCTADLCRCRIRQLSPAVYRRMIASAAEAHE